MIVRVRLQPLRKLLLRMTADLLVVLGVGGMLVWLWGLSDGAVYQYSQGVQFSREAAHSDVRIAGNPILPEASPRNRLSPAGSLPRCPSPIHCCWGGWKYRASI